MSELQRSSELLKSMIQKADRNAPLQITPLWENGDVDVGHLLNRYRVSLEENADAAAPGLFGEFDETYLSGVEQYPWLTGTGDRVASWIETKLPSYGEYGGRGLTGGNVRPRLKPGDSAEALYMWHDADTASGNIYGANKELAVQFRQNLDYNPLRWDERPASVLYAAAHRAAAEIYFNWDVARREYKYGVSDAPPSLLRETAITASRTAKGLLGASLDTLIR